MIRHSEVLESALRRIDGRGYKAYKSLAGKYRFDDYLLNIDHVQGDPFADLSRFHLLVPLEKTGITDEMTDGSSRRAALEDYLARRLSRVIGEVARGSRGTGNSGKISIPCGGQEVLVQTAVLLDDGEVEIRLGVGLPAAGRTVLGREAGEMIFREIPEMVRRGLRGENLCPQEALEHVRVVEDQDFLRGKLKEMGLVSFLAEGALLPRMSGVDERPLQAAGAVPLTVPARLSATANLPNRGRVEGLGIPPGVTLIVGGGFHGKSTILDALMRGVYNHVPGDGREMVVTLENAVKIRAEDGRSVSGVDISPFIGLLPGDRETGNFSSTNASGSTSQAANIIESLEAGAELMLVDEDTSATNFMIRDERMQALVAKEKEPITPFVDKVRQLYRDRGVSTILVMGGSGDYFDVADRVIMMDNYHPREVTGEARSVASRHPTGRRGEGGEVFGEVPHRVPDPSSFSARRGKRPVKIEARGRGCILYGRTDIDLSAVEQIVSESQARGIGWMIHHFARHYAGGDMTLSAGLDRVFGDVRAAGLDVLTPFAMGNLALPRKQEVAAAINRMRTLRLARDFPE
jgi:predicted ABC-class ATPase